MNLKTALLLIMVVLSAVPLTLAGNGVSFYIKRNTILEYNATFYVVVNGIRGEPIEANVSAIIVNLYNNYSVIQEFKYVHVVGANNTSRTLEYRDRLRIFYPSANSMVTGPGVIPYVVSKSVADTLWAERINELNISFWNLTNISIRLTGSVVNTSLGPCKCIAVNGLYRKEFLVHNVTAILCYNRYGLLGYANISTGYLEPENMRNNTRVIVYQAVNASVKLNKTALEQASTTTNTSTATETNAGGGFNCTMVYLPIILFIIGFGAWFRYKYLKK